MPETALWLVLALCVAVAGFAAFKANVAHVANAPAVADLHKLATLARTDVEALRAEWMTFRKETGAALEAFEDLADVTERRRRRVAAAESRQNAAPPEPLNAHAAARARARAAGLPV